MRYLFLSILVSYLLVSCIKENNNNNNSIVSRVTINAGNYRTSDTLYNTPPILYTRGLEITDQQVIKAFLNKHHVSDFITFNNFEINNDPVTFHFSSGFSFPIEPHNPDPAQVSFVNKSPVTITTKTDIRSAIINGIRLKYDIEKPSDSSTVIKLTRTDDSIPYFRVSYPDLNNLLPDTISNFYSLTLEEFRGLFQYAIGCPIIIGGSQPDTNYIYKCSYFPQFPLQYINKQFQLPMFTSFLYTSYNDSLYMTKNEWNYFFPVQGYRYPSNWLSAGDTLVVQNKSAVLYKE